MVQGWDGEELQGGWSFPWGDEMYLHGLIVNGREIGPKCVWCKLARANADGQSCEIWRCAASLGDWSEQQSDIESI